MLKNYIKIAIRNLLKNKVFSVINIFGLALGLCCTILIGLWVIDEYAVNRFHSKGDRLYMVVAEIQLSEHAQYWTNTPGILAKTIESDVSGVEEAIKVSHNESNLILVGEKNYKERGRFVDPEFLKVFDFPLASGDQDKALEHLNNIVLSHELAEKFFPGEEAMGKTIVMEDMGEKEPYTVTGVLEKLPKANTLQFDYLVSYEKFLSKRPWNTDWGNYNDMTFVLLQENANYKNVSSQTQDLITKYQEESRTVLHLYPYQDIYLKSDFSKGLEEGGRIVYVRIFTIVGIIVLLIACINFMNLSTARAGKRAKEVGVRKATGAYKSYLVTQFLGESVFITFIALLVAITLSDLLIPYFNQLTDKELFMPYREPLFVGSLLSLTLVVGLIAGMYPALRLSSFKPASVLKGAQHSGKSLSGIRRVLVIVQFATSIIFIIATIVVYTQLQFVMNKDLGINKENILYHIGYGLEGKSEAYKHDLKAIPGVKSVAFTNSSPLSIGNTTYSPSWDGKGEDSEAYFHVIQTDRDVLEAFDITLIEGKGFPEKVDTAQAAFIINEEAAKVMGMEEPVGENLSVWGNSGKIIGVVKDFHHQSLFKGIEPVIIYYNPANAWMSFVSIDGHNVSETVEAIGEVYKKYEDEHPFEYRFVEEAYQSAYQSVETAGSLTNIFAIIAIIVSGMGLFGLSSYMTEQRKKETGIRKVFGASILQLLALFSRDLLKLVGISILISLPVAWYFVDNWLQGFAFKVELSWLPFLIAAAFATFIALITVSYHTIKTARANPVKSLRYE